MSDDIKYLDKYRIYLEFLKDPKYKTEMCVNYNKYGKCRYNTKCRYAHGGRELLCKKNIIKNYKYKPCINFHNLGYCSYGSRCQFQHDERSLINRTYALNLILLSSSFFSNILKNNDPSLKYKPNKLPIFKQMAKAGEKSTTQRRFSEEASTTSEDIL